LAEVHLQGVRPNRARY